MSEPKTCSVCGESLETHNLRTLLQCHHGEEAGADIADRVADRLQRDLDNGLAEKMARAVNGALALRQVIADAPASERPALISHAKSEIAKRRGF